MKKLIAFIMAIQMLLSITACSTSQTKGSKVPDISSSMQSTTAEKSALTVSNIIEKMGKKISISDSHFKSAEMIGAVEGESISVGSNDFEIYKFENPLKIDEAKTGKMLLFNSIEMKASVNGNFVMLYKTADETVIDAFKSAK